MLLNANALVEAYTRGQGRLASGDQIIMEGENAAGGLA